MRRRYWASGGGCGGGWPLMYVQQPGGWAEQTWGMGYGRRPNNNNDDSSNGNNNNNNRTTANINNLLFPAGSPTDALSLDALSALFTRLILQNHLTRLAGDALSCPSGGGGGACGNDGGALWGCSLPPPLASSTSPTPSCHHRHGCDGSAPVPCPRNVNMCTHTNNSNNNINMAYVCHTCPAATKPYMGPHNVFVIPAGHIGGGGGLGLGGLGGLSGPNYNIIDLNMFLSALGLALGTTASPGASVSFSPATGHHNLPVFDRAPWGQTGHGELGFSCSRCNFQMM
ncbi:hypothetical protein M406DRAFT_74980 [Cryphonectria parasitica EP155]|uniref:Uncharacterized protein n=1 Tax=Cryphonectria parasitica (strain ATCC 38755 / EP155) TaxID=660469 RepID=A0A9P5CNB9_CRYP1|nr:uncharacterized protein M406DRAFT_74980 [Cryphonectria parasitica EP155]KAF3763745.1 hypothetical protein M406DRAFT_74980 [Cryphonectria parasitica EP155]